MDCYLKTFLTIYNSDLPITAVEPKYKYIPESLENLSHIWSI